MTAKNHKPVFCMKRKEIERIRGVLDEVRERKIWHVKDSYKHNKPWTISLKTYLDVSFPVPFDEYKKGYSLEVDTVNKKITAGSMYSTETSHYVEEPFTKDELHSLLRYYGFEKEL